MDLKRFLKKHRLRIIVLLILLLFFYPKHCGNWGTAIHPDAKYKDCICVGLKYSEPKLGGGYISCFGIPISYSCYYYEGRGTGEDWKVERIEIPCNNECEDNGGECYGFGDFAAETCEDHEMITLPYRCQRMITLNTQCCMKK